MKKYNNFDRHMVLLGIIIPFLVFFISMNTTFAFFTATATKKESSATTATVQITFKTNEGVSSIGKLINGTDSGEVKLVPGDTLIVNGTLTNSGSADAYAVIEYTINVTPQNSQKETHLKRYFTFDGDTLKEITGTTDNYSELAGMITSKTSKTFTLPDYTFTGANYGNEYKNAKVEYVVKANAIQTANITQEKATNELMNNIGYNATKVYGNSYQVIGTGKNLFDVNNYTYKTQNLQLQTIVNNKFTLHGNVGASSNAWSSGYLGIFLPKTIQTTGKTFTLSLYVTLLEKGSWEENYFTIYYENDLDAIKNVTRTIPLGERTRVSATFKNATADLKSFRIYLNNFKMIFELDTLQVEFGDTATEYEPYTGGVPAPTPTNPSEIQSVGEKTKNLLKLDRETLELDYTNPEQVVSLSMNKVYTSYAASGYFTKNRVSDLELSKSSIRFLGTYAWYGIGYPLSAKANTKYSFSWETDCEKIKANITYYSNGLKIMDKVQPLGSVASTAKSGTFTTPENCDMVIISFVPIEDNTIVWAKNIQWEESSTATAYEPYGYKISFNMQTKNLLPYPYYDGSQTISGISYKVNGNGSITLNGTATASHSSFDLISISNPILFKAGTYTLSGNSIQDGVRVWFREPNSGTNLISTYNNNSTTITLSQDTNMYCYISINSGTVIDNVTIYPMLEEGTTATEFEPCSGDYNIYLDEPLRSVGDVCDYLDIETGTVVRKVCSLKLAEYDIEWNTWGVSTSVAGQTGFYKYYKQANLPLNDKTTTEALCNIVGYNAWSHSGSNVGCCSNKDGYITISLKNSDLGITDSSTNDEAIAAFKNLIKEKNVEFQYILATPVEEKIINSGISIPKDAIITTNSTN